MVTYPDNLPANVRLLFPLLTGTDVFCNCVLLITSKPLPTVSDPDVPSLRGTTNLQQTSVSLDWNFGATAVKHSSVVSYRDISSTDPQWQTTEVTDRLTGLTPGRTYLFYVCVRSFDKTECSANDTVTTREYNSLKPNSITLASSELAPNMFGACSELVRS